MKCIKGQCVCGQAFLSSGVLHERGDDDVFSFLRTTHVSAQQVRAPADARGSHFPPRKYIAIAIAIAIASSTTTTYYYDGKALFFTAA